MHKYNILLLMMSLSVLSSIGCSNGAGIDTPEVSLVNLSNPNFKTIGGTAAFEMRIGNPNPDAITVEGLTVRLIANNESFAKGMGSVAEKIPPYGNKDIRLAATISNLSLMKTAISTAISQKIDYSMQVKITFKDKDGQRHTRNVIKNGKLNAASLIRK